MRIKRKDLLGAITNWLPEPSSVQIRERLDWTFRVDIETCGGQSHFFISSEPDYFATEFIKPVVDAALHDIWSRGLT